MKNFYFSTKDGRITIKQYKLKATHYQAIVLSTFITRTGRLCQLLLRFFGSHFQAQFLGTSISIYLKLPRFSPRKATLEEQLFL